MSEKDCDKRTLDDVSRSGYFTVAAGMILVIAFGIFVGVSGISMTAKTIIPCIFKNITGLYCPCCGATRSLEALYRFDIIKSLWYYPPLIFSLVSTLIFFIKNTCFFISKGRVKPMNLQAKWFYALLVIIGANFALKNALLLIWNIRM